MARQVISSPKLLGITRLDEHHRGRATMHSTGRLRQAFGGDLDPGGWTIEFKCEICDQFVYENESADLDLIREVLRDAGIISG
jgi:hypothetical protein